MTATHDLFRKARKIEADKANGRPNHAPTVALIMVQDFRKAITGHAELHQFLLMNGALPNVEAWMKRGRRRDETSQEKTPPPEQLTLQWPEHIRPIVEQIDRDALYVPSLDEYVPLQPGVSKDHLREAARHLRAHGEDTLRVAGLVDRLADLVSAAPGSSL
jgi:hypothetical protein